MSNFATLFAMANMSGVPVAVAILLVVGVWVLRCVRTVNDHSRSNYLVPVLALVTGPLVAVLYFLADVFVISRDYETVEDYFQVLIPFLILGVSAGVIGAIGLWIGDKYTSRRIR